MDTFEASKVTRAMVIAAQVALTPFMVFLYTVHPSSLHRFVGYLEETAVHTYKNVIDHTLRPGTLLHQRWANMDAPTVAKGYWKLPADAKWVDALKCMMADEAHHRDVNHTLANTPRNDPNPFATEHKQNAALAWRLENEGRAAWKHATKAVGRE